MSQSKDDGGPAYPHSFEDTIGHPNWLQSQGMTLRDWFAGQAIMGLCADPSNHELFDGPDDAAENAYAIADAMLAERSKP